MLPWNGVTPVQQGGLGAFIRTRRKEIGMSSQDDLAELAEVNQKTISNMENDRNFRSPLPPPDVVAAVARALRVAETELIRAAGYLTDSPAAKRLDDDGDEYIAKLDSIAAALGPEQMPRFGERIIEVLQEEFLPRPPSERQQEFGGR